MRGGFRRRRGGGYFIGEVLADGCVGGQVGDLTYLERCQGTSYNSMRTTPLELATPVACTV